MRKWTIFGAGNLIFDICNAIESMEDEVEHIVLNQKVKMINPDPYKVITFKKFLTLENKDYYSSRCSIFGFVDPNKEKFIGKIPENKKKFFNVVHARAYIAAHPIICPTGVGNYFGPNVTIAPKVNIGSFNYFNRNCSIGHHTKIDAFNHFGPGSTICGRCEFGQKNSIGAGATIIDGIKIADNIIVGAGAVVTKDLLEPGTYVGVPARKLLPPPPMLFRCD